MVIKSLKGFELLDSRGDPTVGCRLELTGGQTVYASVPQGASKGAHEALELRDGDNYRFCGKGVLKAIQYINLFIAPALEGKEYTAAQIDQFLIALEGASDKHTIGANTLLAVSMATARAQAALEELPLYRYFMQQLFLKDLVLPQCMFNILNGGMHAGDNLFIQEIMIIPQGMSDIASTLNAATRVYHFLKILLEQNGLITTIGDEGGFAPLFSQQGFARERQALRYVVQAIEAAGFTEKEIALGLDVAISRAYDREKKTYTMYGQSYSARDVISLYQAFIDEFPIMTLEDGMAEDDVEGWHLLNQSLGNRVWLVGDDLYTTNVSRIAYGIDHALSNGVLIKPNQIGTVTQAVEALLLGKLNNWKTVVSHRSGETNDDFIVDLAVGLRADYLKAGACARGERVAKYNRLWAIERGF